MSNERIPISARLGPIADDQAPDCMRESEAPEQIQRRKPGRPPRRRTVNESHLLLPGVISKKRKVQQTKQPNYRKKIQMTQERTEKSAKEAGGKRVSTRAGIPHEEGSTKYDNVPICNLIPRTTKRMMDFRIQSNPAP